MGMPQNITPDDPAIFHLLFWIIMLGAIRATVLWFQTLAHAVKHVHINQRFVVVLGHFFLGPIMAYGYYYISRRDAKREISMKE